MHIEQWPDAIFRLLFSSSSSSSSILAMLQLSEFFAISLIYRREHIIISLKMKMKNNFIFLLSYGKKKHVKKASK